MSTLFDWLDKASRCGDREVEMAAEVMKDYYQGVPPVSKVPAKAIPKITAADRERLEKDARKSTRKNFPQLED